MTRRRRSRPRKLGESESLPFKDEEQKSPPTEALKASEFEVLFERDLERLSREGLRPEDKSDEASSQQRSAKFSKKDRDQDRMRGRRMTRESSRQQVDLHGLTVAEATRFVEQELTAIIQRLAHRQTCRVRIVTGKGHHSGPGGPVLPGAIHRFVEERFHRSIVVIGDAPDSMVVDGVAVLGHFDVVLSGAST